MSKDFDSMFSALFARTFGKKSDKEYTWSGNADSATNSGTSSDASNAMDQIEAKIAAMESLADAQHDLAHNKGERDAVARETETRVDDELAALKRQALEMKEAAGSVNSSGDALASPSKVKLVVGEPKKLLPALRKQKLNLPKRLKD